MTIIKLFSEHDSNGCGQIHRTCTWSRQMKSQHGVGRAEELLATDGSLEGESELSSGT